MTDTPRAGVDDRLREAFEADPRAAARIAREALAARPRLWHRGWLVAASATAAAGLAGALAFWPSQPKLAQQAPQVSSDGIVRYGSLTDGVLVVSLPDGSAGIVGGAARRDRPSDGIGLVFVEGGPR